MQFNEYADKAMALRLPTADSVYAVYNLSGEVGELCSVLAKARRDGAPSDLIEKVLKESGDVLWQLTAVLSDFGLSLEDAASHNLMKLYSRKDRGVLQGSGDNR